MRDKSEQRVPRFCHLNGLAHSKRALIVRKIASSVAYVSVEVAMLELAIAEALSCR